MAIDTSTSESAPALTASIDDANKIAAHSVSLAEPLGSPSHFIVNTAGGQYPWYHSQDRPSGYPQLGELYDLYIHSVSMSKTDEQMGIGWKEVAGVDGKGPDAKTAAELSVLSSFLKEQYYGNWYHNAGIVSSNAGRELMVDRLLCHCDPFHHRHSSRLGMGVHHSRLQCDSLLAFCSAHPSAGTRRHSARACQDSSCNRN